MEKGNAIEEKRRKLLEALEQEEQAHGSYREWQAQLEPFRESLSGHYRRFGLGYRAKPGETAKGDVIDHHVLSYLAPLSFRRKGWGGKRRTAAEQVILLWGYMKRRGTRLVYAALPNKGAVYPEGITGGSVSLPGGSNPPAYRKMLKEIALGGWRW